MQANLLVKREHAIIVIVGRHIEQQIIIGRLIALQIIQQTKTLKSKMKRAIVLLSILFVFNSCNRSKIFDAYVAFEKDPGDST